jgi:murein endopeptidase
LQADDYDDINDDELKELVRTWAIKKMATQFQTWKKTLSNTYIKKNLTSNFNTSRGSISKLRPYWNDFVEYKTSAEGEARVRRNQENARKKVYHHDMGLGGYKTTIPMW